MNDCIRQLITISIHLNGNKTICTSSDSDRGRNYDRSLGSALVSRSNKLIGIALRLNGNLLMKNDKIAPNIYTAIFPYKEWIQTTITNIENEQLYAGVD